MVSYGPFDLVRVCDRLYIIYNRQTKERRNQQRQTMNSIHHRHMARGGHELPKGSLGPFMPYPSKPCGRATLEMALQLFQEYPTHRASSLRPSSTPLGTPRHTPMLFTLGNQNDVNCYNDKNDTKHLKIRFQSKMTEKMTHLRA
jgi:hypothetical protein